MSADDLVVRARAMITSAGTHPGWVGVRDGTITAVELLGASPPEGVPIVDLADDEVLLPGLVDTHVHVNEPGRTEWEGFASATRAAAAGGVTTVIDMPLNSVPATLDVPSLQAKQAAAIDQIAVDVGFWGGAVPTNLGDLEPLHEAGVFGVKCFLVPSGVDEFAHLDGENLVATMTEVARLDMLLLVHAEDEATLAAATAGSSLPSLGLDSSWSAFDKRTATEGHLSAEPRPAAAGAPPDRRTATAAQGGRGYADYLRARPPEVESVAVARLVDLVERTGARTHVVHVASGDAADLIAAARTRGLPISGETCPHYLTLAAEDVPDGATPYKCCPPIRGRAEQDRLWAALAAGALCCVVSDHSPCPPALKCVDSGDFDAAWGGITSLQLGLPVVWTAARSRGVDLATVVGWMATAPADLVGLPYKGRIAVGDDADLMAFAPDERWTVDPAQLHHRHPMTPYAGRSLTGHVRRTWLRGVAVDAEHPHGRLLVRTDSAAGSAPIP